MEQLRKNKEKILIALVCIILIAGIAMVIIKGFNFELKYQDTQKIEIYLNKEFNISDIKNITNEILKDKPVMIQKVELYEDMVSITSNEITEEQKENIITKINEKYGTEVKKEEVQIQNVPHTRGRDIIKPYIVPFVLVTVIILVYIAIRYSKLGKIQMVFKTAMTLITAEALLASVIAITRIPIGKTTIPLALAVYLLTLVAITNHLEKELNEIKKEDN